MKLKDENEDSDLHELNFFKNHKMEKLDLLKSQYETAEQQEEETWSDLSALKQSICDQIYFLTCWKNVRNLKKVW